jgi:hypothetical protein
MGAMVAMVLLRFLALVAMVALGAVATACGDQSEGPAPDDHVKCSSGAALSCYYTDTNRPVDPPQSLSYKGKRIPIVGLLPSICQTAGACSVVGSSGFWSIWQIGPALALEATYRSVTPASGSAPGRAVSP